ncbi:MAG: DUF4175 family protein [Alphaproteobacteria bacterium]|nr:DUF4175 family protein [Alphaproteobacteria bacterium]
MSNRIDYRPGWKTDRIERRIALARAIVAFERIWPRLWPASGLVGLWLAAGLYGVFAFIPGWLQLFFLLTLIVAIAELSTQQWQSFVWPSWHDGARRLERDSTLAHRPISEGDDTLAIGRGNAYTEALWRAHRRARLARIARLHLGLAHPGLARQDRYGLRFVVLALLLGAILVAGRSWPARLAAAFLPDFTPDHAAGFSAWITPPPYSGEAPIYLTAHTRQIQVPQGSQLVIRVHGALAPPRLTFAHGRMPRFSPASGGSASEFMTTSPLRRSNRIAVIADGHRLADWHVEVLPNRPPVVAFAAPPTRTARDSTRFSIRATDQYGIAKLAVTLTPLEGARKIPLVVTLPVDDPHATTLNETVYEDLTASRYAGTKVHAVLTATDAAGKRGLSAPVTFTLPQRIFTDPLARALVEQRRTLILGDVAAIPKVVRALGALTLAPQYFFVNRLSAYLAIRTAYHALRDVHDRHDITRVENLLWQTALALDHGEASDLAQQLRALQAMLTKALASGAPQDQIAQLMQRYQQVLKNYLAKLGQNALRTTPQSPGRNVRIITGQELEDMMKAIEQLAQVGDRGKAAQMLALLQNLIENMHVQSAQGMAGNGSSAQDKAAEEAIKKLGDVTGRQRELLDRTYRQREGDASPADGGPRGLARDQGKLKGTLGQVLSGLGAGRTQIPKSLKDAERAMGKAEAELFRRDLYGAGTAQQQALQDLQKGIAGLAEQAQAGLSGQQAGSQDPFGRPEGAQGAISGEDLHLPDKAALKRARQILRELRQRAGERGRPKEELDYIDRLLKEFD